MKFSAMIVCARQSFALPSNNTIIKMLKNKFEPLGVRFFVCIGGDGESSPLAQGARVRIFVLCVENNYLEIHI